jgi:hypothetical protein
MCLHGCNWAHLVVMVMVSSLIQFEMVWWKATVIPSAA